MKLTSLIKINLTLLFIVMQQLFVAQNVKFKRISIDEGLSQASVNGIFQDSQDFIWIGTQDGLNRYDGYHMKVFKTDPGNKNALASNEINCFFEDNDGLLYIGTNDQGLSIYNKFNGQFINFKSGLGQKTLSSNSVRCILNLNETEILIATDAGLNIFNKTKKEFRKINVAGSIAANDLKQIYRDKNNNIWLASYENGLFQFDEKNQTLLHHAIPDKINKIETSTQKKQFRCFVEVNNNLWCGTDEGILVFSLSDFKFIDVKNQLKENSNSQRIVSFAKDNALNVLWIATWEGLIKYNIYNETFIVLKNNELDQNSISNNKISNLLFDKQKNLWIGTTDKGINIYFPSSVKFPIINKNNGLINDYIYSVIQTKDKNIWIGAEEGLYVYRNKDSKIENYTHILDKYNVTTVLSLFEDANNNNIWIGTYGQGIIVYNTETKKSKTILGESNASGTITKIIQTKNGLIWVATYSNGLYAINPKTFSVKNYSTQDGLPSDKIYSIYENPSDNTLWISTDGEGFCILNFVADKEKPLITKFRHQENRNSLSSNVVNNIYKDKSDVFWIATGNGLNRFDYERKTFSAYFEKDGLVNTYIYDILPDNKGNLWLPSNSGLTKFNPNIINENGSAFKNYNTKDGIQAREFNQGASFLCSDGKMLVGGVSGLNYFNPNEIKESKIKSKSYIYEFSRQGNSVILDTNIIYKKHIELNYKENYFTLEFVTLDFISPDKNKFMFILEGYDEKWSSPTNIRYISYTSLPGGYYTFKLKATNSDGVWNEIPYQITIKVIPPWYKTILFYVSSSILLIVLIFGFTNYRTNSIKKENKILETKVSERTHELAEKNRDITSSIEYAKRIQEAILPEQELIFSKFKKAFILYRPKDIVSGDFYWFGEKDNYKIIATVDCTGHGVPGAFMSMIGHNLLNQIIVEKATFDPGLILQELHKGIQAALKQGQGIVNTNDGMDVSMIAINTETRDCFWAGAFRSLVVINKYNQLEKIDGNKYPVGGAQLDSERIFTTHVRTLKENDTVYMFTDGYADQFGGEKGKKFMVKRFHDNLLSINKLDMKSQKQEIESHFDNWKGSYDQVDDVLVIGIKM